MGSEVPVNKHQDFIESLGYYGEVFCIGTTVLAYNSGISGVHTANLVKATMQDVNVQELLEGVEHNTTGNPYCYSWQLKGPDSINIPINKASTGLPPVNYLKLTYMLYRNKNKCKESISSNLNGKILKTSLKMFQDAYKKT